MNIFRTKDVSLRQTEMHRHLKLWDLILLGIGAMVGTGIFTITGTAAATLAGPSLVISIVISALCVSLSALFFAEFASRVPATGGAYSYLYAILGELPAWIAGWLTIMEFMTAVSGVASGWAAYFKGLLSNYGISMPQALNGTFNPEQGTYIDLLPILVLTLVTGLVLLNSKAALRFNSLLVVLKFSALALFILVGIWYIKPENWTNFAPFGFGQLYGGSTGIMAGASLMFFGFLGFESISMAVDEIQSPQKNIPRGIVLSLMIYSLARDGLLPQSFKQLSKTSRVPKNATLLTGVASAIAAGVFPLASIAAFLNICTLAYLILLAYGIIKLRKDKGMPKEGEFKTPLVPLLPILSILICVSFMLQYSLDTWIAFGIALLVGLVIYFTYGFRHSTLAEEE